MYPLDFTKFENESEISGTVLAANHKTRLRGLKSWCTVLHNGGSMASHGDIGTRARERESESTRGRERSPREVLLTITK